jgi:UDP-N-acetylglucosamine 2-epimerase (non-hydrolysing)
MPMVKVLSVFGTRPEAVKMAPVVRALNELPGVSAMVCVTAQHRQMLDQALDLFDIHPEIDLDLMQPDQSLAGLTAAILTRLDPVLEQLQPDWLFVQGDTTTVLAASLAAYYRRIRVAHVEAGLRTGDKWQPFPEEINRRVAGVAADLHFAATESAAANLRREGIPPETIFVTGNPVIDALQIAAALPPSPQVRDLFARLGLGDPTATVRSPRLVLITAHRRENFGAPLEAICAALAQLARRYPETRFVYPVHLNPNVHEPVHRLLGGLPNLTLLPPLDYLPWVYLMKRASLLLTDSGGLQEEAPALGVPVLVLREVTERPEGIQAGTVRLVGTNERWIVAEARRLLDDPQAHANMVKAVNPYGDGKAARRIARIFARFNGLAEPPVDGE